MQNLFRDLGDPKWMVLKAALFFGILLSSCGILLMDAPAWRTVLLLGLIVWSAARLYYFAFYVIEKYIDPDYRFSGIGAALWYLWGRRRRG